MRTPGGGRVTRPLDHAQAAAPGLVIRHGPVRRGGRVVLEPCALEVPLPATVGVAGVNGSGKSSLFMLLAGVLAGGDGRIGRAGGGAPSLAFVPQEAALPGWVRSQAAAELYGLQWPWLAARFPGLHLAELEGRRVGTLSTGQRQALALAVALGREADVLLLDEPFSALDYRRRSAALEAVHDWRLARADRAVIVASQVGSDLTALCDHFIVLRGGRAVFAGPRSRLGGDGRLVERALLALLE